MMDFARLGFSIDGRPLRDAARDLKNVGRAGGTASRGVAEFERSAHSAGRSAVLLSRNAAGLAKGLLASFGAGQAAMAAREFSAALDETSTLLTGTAKETYLLNRESVRLAGAYGGSAAEQAKAYYSAISAGASSVGQATKVVEAANQIAIGGVTDVQTAVAALSTATNAYSASGLTAAAASDALFTAIKGGQTNARELAASLGQIVPIASSAGVSFDELLGGVAALTTQGQSTAMATTGLRQTIASIIAPTQQAKDVARDLGIQFSAAALESKGLGGILQDVAAKTGGSKEAMATLFGSVEALNAVLAFSGGAGEKFSQIMEEMGDKTGATAEAVRKIVEGDAFRLDLSLSRIGNLAVRAGEAMLAIFVPAIEKVGQAAQFIAENFHYVEGAAIALAGVVTGKLAWSIGTKLVASTTAAIGQQIALEIALGATSRTAAFGSIAVKGLAGAFRLLRGAIIATGIGAVAVGAAVAIGKMIQLTRATGSVGEAFQLVQDVVGESFERIGLLIEAGQTKMFAWGASIRATVADAMAGALDSVKDWANKTVGAFVGAYEAVKAAWEMLPDVFRAVGAKAVNALIGALESGLNGIPNKINEWLDELGVDASRRLSTFNLQGWKVKFEEVGSVAEAAGAAFRSAFNADYVGPMVNGLRETAGEARKVAEAAGVVAHEFSGVAGLPMKSVANMKDVLSDFADSEADAADNAKRLSEELADSGGSGGGVGGAARKAAEEMGGAQEAAKKLAEELKGKVISAVDGVANAFGDFVVGGFRDFKGFVNSVLGSFKKMLSQMIAMAAKNKILVSLGLATAPAAGVAKQALGGIGGSISGIIGKALGSWGGGSGILGGLGSVVTGFMKGGLGGAVSGLTTAIGGGLTSAIGGLLPVVGLAAAAFSFFRGKTKQLDAGLRVTIGQAGLLAEEFKKVEKSRFWGLSKRTSTTYSAVADDLQNSLSSAFNDIKASASSAASAIGLSAAALDGYSKQITLSTKGMSGDQAQQALLGKLQGLSSDMAMAILKSAAPTAIFAGLSDEVAKMAPGAVGPVKKALSAALSGAVSRSGASVSAGAVSQLAGRVSGAVSNALKQSAATVGQSAADLAREQWAQQFIRPGEDAAQALQALSGSFTTINAALKGLGLQMMGASLDMAKVARDVLDQVGGAQAFGQAADLYFNQFYSVAERASLMGGRFADAMAGLKVGPLPKTMAEFRALVDELNAAGKNADAVKVISLAPLFNEVIRLREEAKPAAEAVKEVAKALDNTADIARERQNLLRRLYEAQGNTVALRKMELEALFPANQALQNRIWGILDETKASEAAAEAARAAKAELDRIKGEHMGLMRELWRLQGREDLLRKDQLAGLAASNRALQRNIWALQDQAKAAQDLEDATRSTIDLLRSPLALDSQRYANRYDAALAAARERDREIEGKARDAQTTELRLIRAALSRIEQDARDTNLQGS